MVFTCLFYKSLVVLEENLRAQTTCYTGVREREMCQTSMRGKQLVGGGKWNYLHWNKRKALMDKCFLRLRAVQRERERLLNCAYGEVVLHS